MLRDESMVSYGDTKDMLLGWSMAPRIEGAGRFIPCMLWYRSMVSCVGTTGMLLGWSMTSRIEDVGRFIPHSMLRDVSMVLFASATGMLRGVSMVIQPMDTGRFIPTYSKAAGCSCAFDRGHTNSFFSLMLGLVIIGMMGQAQSCAHLDRTNSDCRGTGIVTNGDEHLLLGYRYEPAR